MPVVDPIALFHPAFDCYGDGGDSIVSSVRFQPG